MAPLSLAEGPRQFLWELGMDSRRSGSIEEEEDEKTNCCDEVGIAFTILNSDSGILST
jgi:hypothetical protein